MDVNSILAVFLWLYKQEYGYGEHLTEGQHIVR